MFTIGNTNVALDRALPWLQQAESSHSAAKELLACGDLGGAIDQIYQTMLATARAAIEADGQGIAGNEMDASREISRRFLRLARANDAINAEMIHAFGFTAGILSRGCIPENLSPAAVTNLIDQARQMKDAVFRPLRPVHFN